MSNRQSLPLAPLLAVLVLLILPLLASRFAIAQTLSPPYPMDQLAKLTATDGANMDYFGMSVSVSGNTIVVGAQGDNHQGEWSGSAYVFERNVGLDHWSQSAKLVASDSPPEGRFGFSVSISRDTVVVGAPDDDSAYVFERNEGGPGMWGEVIKLTATNGTDGDMFGRSVSVNGDTIVVGAMGDGEIAEQAGAAYVFERNEGGPDNWGEVTKLTAADGARIDYFGHSVSVSGDTIVVGAIFGEAAYVFERDEGGSDNWGPVTKLTASDGTDSDSFGGSVSISGNALVVGSHRDDDNGDDSGSAYVFERDQGGPDNWGQIAKLIASDGATSDWFGDSVSISGDALIIGSRYDNARGAASGSAYLFERSADGPDNWSQVAKLVAFDGAPGDYFGAASSIDRNILVVGAYGDDDNGASSGSAYVFGHFSRLYLPMVLRNVP